MTTLWMVMALPRTRIPEAMQAILRRTFTMDVNYDSGCGTMALPLDAIPFCLRGRALEWNTQLAEEMKLDMALSLS